MASEWTKINSISKEKDSAFESVPMNMLLNYFYKVLTISIGNKILKEAISGQKYLSKFNIECDTKG